MGIFGKVAIAVALALPMGAYVAGTLVAGEPEQVRHDPIVMEVPVADDPSPTPPEQRGRKKGTDGTDGEDRGREEPRPGPSDERAEPEVITVDPDDLDDDGGRDVRGDDDGDDREDDRDDDDDGDDDD